LSSASAPNRDSAPRLAAASPAKANHVLVAGRTSAKIEQTVRTIVAP
jgi:hypothetical protein